jgi:hypothetical protein
VAAFARSISPAIASCTMVASMCTLTFAVVTASPRSGGGG